MATATRKLTVGQAARLVGISTQTFNWLVSKGVIVYTIDDLTGWRVYDRAEVERLAEERTKRQRKSA